MRTDLVRSLGLKTVLRTGSAPANGASPHPTLEECPTQEPRVCVRDGYIDVIYATPNAATEWRVETLFSKEPETIEWIGGFHPGEILVDIGANVGIYTIWAAKTRAVRVYAFEPESQNYALLYKNIVLNQLSKQVVAYCAALSDQTGYSMLHLSQFEGGRSNHSYGEEVDYQLEHRESEVSQGCIAATLDSLVKAGVVPRPDHIKIDVDGFEHKVVAGCANVLADRRLKSVLIEINTNLKQHLKIITHMQALGSLQQLARQLRRGINPCGVRELGKQRAESSKAVDTVFLPPVYVTRGSSNPLSLRATNSTLKLLHSSTYCAVKSIQKYRREASRLFVSSSTLETSVSYCSLLNIADRSLDHAMCFHHLCKIDDGITSPSTAEDIIAYPGKRPFSSYCPRDLFF